MGDNSFAGINFNNPESKKIFEQNAKMMCPEFKTINENSFLNNIKIKRNNDNYVLLITGDVIDENNEEYYIKYTAATPPTYSSNFSGSGMPFPNEDIAYDDTPNKGIVQVINGKFSFSIKYPNSYYINMGTIYVEPHVKILLVNKDNKSIEEPKVINLGQGIPFRTLTWPNQRNWSDGPLFYKNNNLPVRTQYQILLDSAYPSTNKIPNNFWGLMPPH
jgi:hypothetical protein